MEQLSGMRVILRPLSYLYISDYLASFTQEVQTILHVPTPDAEYDYMMQRLALQSEQALFFFCIFDALMQNLVGAIEIRSHHYPGQLYTWLHPAYWGKNYFQEALQLVASYYFMCTGSLYFTARTDVHNKRSYKALKKAGFADYAIVQGGYAQQYELLFINSFHFA